MTISSSGPSARADWYPDPRNPALLRYWDGHQWTAHTSPRPAGWGGQEWSPYSQPSRTQRVPDKGSTRTGLPAWAVVALVVFVGVATLAVIGTVLSTPEPTESAGRSSNDNSTPAASEPSDAEASTSAPSPTPTPTPTETEPPKSVVPRLTGMTRDKAEERLTTAGLQLGEVRQVFSPKAPGTVLSQSRRVGASLLAGTTVVLVVAKAYPQVPGVVGRLKAAAVERLKDAGFKVSVTTESRTSGKDGVVLRQSPSGTARAKPGSSITIVVSSVIRPVAPPQNCTPGYDPCLTPASDYDCAGGSGDGPKYTGFVRVTGYDPYDLDADGDGVACE
ncbi:PASTA domain-containing protein [Nocardioides pelophilus]|uniref:PASTA domain-containing protein n=1 Tax=Nocardioides pelophilus TaxID=2172019 RepID=UPI002483DBAF|nr:PASTA domain-containing protein [Nocardioides pelophilus]